VAESVSGFAPSGRCPSRTHGIELRAGHSGPRPRQRCTDWLISGYRLRAEEHVAVDLAHIAGIFLDLEDNSSGNAIAGQQVTANPTVRVPSGGYAHMMEGGVYLVGYHTLHKEMVSQVHRALLRLSVPARPSRIH